MAKELKKSFVLYHDYRMHLSILSDEERGRLLMALFDYSETGKEPELSGAALMAFSFIRAQMDRDTEKYIKTLEKRREAGKKGGRPQKETSEEGEKPEIEETEAEEEAEAEKQTKANESKQKQTKAKKANAFSEEQTKAEETETPPPKEEKQDIQETRFAEFWKLYPKKVGKTAARQSWKRLKPDAELFERIKQAVETAKKSEQWNREGGRFIPNPTTWLNQGRWDDEPVPVQQTDQRYESFDTDDFYETALRRSYETPSPKTAGEDETIWERAMQLKQRIDGDTEETAEKREA